MKAIKYSLALAVPAALVFCVIYSFVQAYQPEQSRLQGQIEAQQYSISSKIPGRIDKILVRRGDQVTKGQLIFTILSPEIEAKLTQARAGQAAAEAIALQASNGARKQEIEAAKDKWQQARTAEELLEKTFDRINNLFQEGVVAEQKKDETLTQLKAARLSSNAAYQMYQMVLEGAREETKMAAADKARMAAGAVQEVEVYAADMEVFSWHDGEVEEVLLQSGELSPQGFPVVTIMDINDAWAVFHVREDRLAEFRKGSTFNAVIPALGEDIHTFRVDHISVMGDFATWRSTSSDRGFDMRSFEVEARPTAKIEGLRAGMSVLEAK